MNQLSQCIARQRYHTAAKLYVGGYSSTTAPVPCKKMQRWKEMLKRAIARALTCGNTLYSHNAAALAVACKAAFGERFMVLTSCNIAQRRCKSERQRRIQADLLHSLHVLTEERARCARLAPSQPAAARPSPRVATHLHAQRSVRARGSCTAHAAGAYTLPERCAHLRLDVYRKRRGSVFSGCSG